MVTAGIRCLLHCDSIPSTNRYGAGEGAGKTLSGAPTYMRALKAIHIRYVSAVFSRMPLPYLCELPLYTDILQHFVYVRAELRKTLFLNHPVAFSLICCHNKNLSLMFPMAFFRCNVSRRYSKSKTGKYLSYHDADPFHCSLLVFPGEIREHLI